jgi:hypothetical protein
MIARRLVLLLWLATAACAQQATAVAEGTGPVPPPVEVVIEERIQVGH